MNTKTQQVEQLPANTVPIQNLLRDRIRREPEFSGFMLEEAVDCLLKNDVITAQLMLRDITNCTIGFKALTRATGIMEKSLMRMLSVKGNPQVKNLFQIIYSLQQLNKVRLEIRAV
jgi:DNA-binding phage protein